MREDRCCLCGKPRGLEQHRKSWSLNCPTAFVPRTTNPDDNPYCFCNDMIVNAAVWRNGGSDDTTHICNDCLRIGIRAIKIAVSEVLNELDAGHDKDAEIAELTKRLAHLQIVYHNVCHDHDRMQNRFAHVLECLKTGKHCAKEKVRIAQWEVDRGPAKEERT